MEKEVEASSKTEDKPKSRKPSGTGHQLCNAYADARASRGTVEAAKDVRLQTDLVGGRAWRSLHHRRHRLCNSWRISLRNSQRRECHIKRSFETNDFFLSLSR